MYHQVGRIHEKRATFIGSILFFSIVQYSTSNAAIDDCICTPATNELDRFHGHVLRRRTRAVVFPNKANLLLKPAFTKAVLDGRPRGLSYSMEFDMYSPLPDSIEGWKPTTLLKNVKQEHTTTQNLKTNTEDKTISQNHSFKLFDTNNILQESSPYIEDNDYYKFPFHDTEEPNDWNYFKSKRSNVNTLFVSRAFKKDATKVKGFASYFHKQPYLDKNNQRSSEFKSNVFHNKKLLTYGPSKTHLHDQNDRERRHLFDQLEVLGSIFKFNMEKCIQRTKCELSSYFKSYGESVMEDIVRIILIPLNTSQLYVQNYNNVNCEHRFAASCPYNVLDFLTRNINSHIQKHFDT